MAFAIAIFGTGVSDFLHLDVGIPYAGTTLLWAVILAAIFWLWQRSEGTLSIHSITTQRREAFYWATVFATFALGTALGDFTATSLHLGYLASGILFGVVILLPALAWWKFGLNSIAAFWMSYVVTRPLGASFADYISKPTTSAGSTSETARRRSVRDRRLRPRLIPRRRPTRHPAAACRYRDETADDSGTLWGPEIRLGVLTCVSAAWAVRRRSTRE